MKKVEVDTLVKLVNEELKETQDQVCYLVAFSSMLQLIQCLR